MRNAALTIDFVQVLANTNTRVCDMVTVYCVEYLVNTDINNISLNNTINTQKGAPIRGK